MKIVLLDADSIGRDIDISMFSDFGEFVIYGNTAYEEIAGRIEDADIVIVNKQEVREDTIKNARNLKLVCVTATGINNLDTEYLDKRGIAWRNVAGYSTEAVAQHTFALALALIEHLPYYNDYVKSGKYIGDTSFTHFANSFHELNGMTWGIIGLGNIGRRVADIAKCFGCNVIYYSASGRPAQEGYRQVSFEELLSSSDIVSVHAPLNDATKKLMDRDAFAWMKPSSIFINVGRGPIVDEEALAWALENNEICAAGLDVLVKEPMSADSPFAEFKDSNRLIITPHVAWAPVEARTRLMKMVYKNIEDFLKK